MENYSINPVIQDLTYLLQSKNGKFSNNLDVINFRCLLQLIEYIKNTHHKGLKFHTNYEQSQIYKLLKEHNIASKHDSVITFSDSSWNGCIDIGRSTAEHISFTQGDAVDYRSHLPNPVAMSNDEPDCISTYVV